MHLAKQVLYQATASPQKPALAYPGGVATYTALAGAIRTAAHQLRSVGLEPGNVVAIDVRNPLHHTALILALELCGITSVSVQTSFSIKVSGLKLDAILVDRFASPPPDVRTIAPDESWFAVNPWVPAADGPGIAEDQYFRIVLSSGTTGIPKCVGLKPRVIERYLLHGYVWPLVSGWRILSMLGFSTSAFMVPLTAVAWGGLACFAASPEEILHTIRLFGVTQLFVASMQLQGLIDAQAGGYEPCPSLRMINVSGSRIPSGLLMRTRAQLCNNVIISYGSTECGLVATVPAAAVEGIETAAGYAMPWARVEVVDENGTVLAPGEAGRLRVSSDEIAEYVADRPEDRNLAPDGWFYPGDVGSVRADGLVMITGRSAELINRGGSIVAPELVEEVLVAKAEIAQAAVFGVTNDKGFEEIWAAVVPRQPYRDEEVLQFCRQRLVEKTPDVLITVDAIPRTDNGKVMRNRLREIAVQRRKANMPRI